MGHLVIIASFLFSVLAGLAGLIWEWVGVRRELKHHPEPQNGAGVADALKRKALLSPRPVL